MLFTRKLKPFLNLQTDSIRANVFTWRTCDPLLLPDANLWRVEIKPSHYLFTLPWEWCHDDAETLASTLIFACLCFTKSSLIKNDNNDYDNDGNNNSYN